MYEKRGYFHNTAVCEAIISTIIMLEVACSGLVNVCVSGLWDSNEQRHNMSLSWEMPLAKNYEDGVG